MVSISAGKKSGHTHGHGHGHGNTALLLGMNMNTVMQAPAPVLCGGVMLIIFVIYNFIQAGVSDISDSLLVPTSGSQVHAHDLRDYDLYVPYHDISTEDDDAVYSQAEGEGEAEAGQVAHPQQPHQQPQQPHERDTSEASITVTKAQELYKQHKIQEGQIFEPGSLTLTRSEAIAHCYLKPGLKYKVAMSCAHSPENKVLMSLNGKTGTSTQRRVVTEVWKGTLTQCYKLEDQGLEPGTKRVVVTREPLDHFISGYKEILVRARLWDLTMDEVYERGHIPKPYNRFLSLLDPKLEKRGKDKLKKSNHPKDLKLKAKMLEQFVQDYDGRNFDDHLGLQSIKLRRNFTHMKHFDITLDSERLTEEFEKLAKDIGAPIPPPVQSRSHAGEPTGDDLVSDQTIQKICRLRAADYCCMNYQLPDICKKAIPEERVQCQWVQHPKDDQLLAIKAINEEPNAQSLYK